MLIDLNRSSRFHYEIKTQTLQPAARRVSEKTKKTRLTLAKRIIAMVNSPDATERIKAMVLARYGKTFDEIEGRILNFYLYYKDMRAINISKKGAKLKVISIIDSKTEFSDREREVWETGTAEMVKKFEGDICRMFMDAVKTHNAAKIIQIANAVSFFKDNIGDGSKYADEERSKLLFLKYQTERTGGRLTVRQVASILNSKKYSHELSALRRMCRQINFPLKESRKRKISRR